MTRLEHAFILTMLASAACFLWTGCTDQVLNPEPKNVVSSEDVWDDPELADSFLGEAYQNLSLLEDDSWYSHAQSLDDVMGGAVRNQGTWQVPWTLSHRNFGEQGLSEWPGWALDYWRYGNVRNLNSFIENVRASDFPESYKTKRIAEARWLRAFTYLMMAKRFGGVPLITKAQSEDAPRDSLFVDRSSEQEVYDFVLSELDAIIEGENGQGTALSTARSGDGRPTKWAALALKSRAALYAASTAEFGGGSADLADQSELLGIPQSEADRYWQAAYDASTRIIENGPHRLYEQHSDPAENFEQLFLTECEDNPEAIFCEHYNGTDKAHNYSYMGDPAPQQASWGSNYCATLNVVEKFEVRENDGSSSRMISRSELTRDQGWTQEELFGDRDPRFKGSIQYPEKEFAGETLYYHAGTEVNGEIQETPRAALNDVDSTTSWPQAGAVRGWRRTGFLVAKRVKETPGVPADLNVSNEGDDTDWIEFRLGEMYLNAAEAAFYLNNGQAQGLIDDLRARADMPSQSVTEELIRLERQRELAFEKHLYWDLRRWRIAEETLDEAEIKGAEMIYDWDEQKYFVSIFNAEGDARRVFRTRHYYLPLGADRVADTQLRENPGY